MVTGAGGLSILGDRHRLAVLDGMAVELAVEFLRVGNAGHVPGIDIGRALLHADLIFDLIAPLGIAGSGERDFDDIAAIGLTVSASRGGIARTGSHAGLG